MTILVSKCKAASKGRLAGFRLRGAWWLRFRAPGAAGLIAAAASACFSPVEQLPVILWEAQMEGEVAGVGSVTASVAMVANEAATQIGIGIQGGAQGVPLEWSVHQGTCGSPGALVVDQSFFEILVADAEGEADAEVRLNRRIDTGASYSARIRQPQGEIVACGELERLN